MLMTLASSLRDDPTEWLIFLGTFVLYVLTRWFLSWQQDRREGDNHPVRAALAEEDDFDALHAATVGRFRSYRQLTGFALGAMAVALVATLTKGELRVILLWIVIPLLVIALAYLDFRTARNARSRAPA